MSHACVLVSPRKELIEEVNDIERAVEWEMEPFKEDGWFSDGSRWDWYQIGGRMAGLLTSNIIQVKHVTAMEIPAAAFLRNRHWHEAKRMGWFGSNTYTECELKDLTKPQADPTAWFGKCLYKMDEKQARIMCWNEPWKVWKEAYKKRFVDRLMPDDVLVVVDYHV